MVRQTRHLWIGNLPDKISEDRIKEHFKRYGRVQNIKMLPPESSLSTEADSYTSASQPLLSSSSSSSTACTVAFMDIQSAAKALSFEHQIDNRLLTTRYYEPSSVTISSTSQQQQQQQQQQQSRSNRSNSPATGTITSSSLSPVVSSSASSSSSSSSSPSTAASPTTHDDLQHHRSQRPSRVGPTNSSPLQNGVVLPATNSNGGCDYTRVQNNHSNVTGNGSSNVTTSSTVVSGSGTSGSGSGICGAVGGGVSSRHLQSTNSLNAASVVAAAAAASQLHHFGSSSSRRGFFAPAPPSTPSPSSLPSAVAVVAAAAANLYGNGPHRVWPLSSATSTPVSYDNNRSSSSSSSISRNHHRTNSSIDLNDDLLLRRKIDRHSHRKHIKRSLNRSSDDKSRSGSKSDSLRSRSHSRTRSRSENSRSRSRSRSLLSRHSKMSASRSRTRSRNRSRTPRSRSITRSSSSSSSLSSSSSPASTIGCVSSGFDASVEAAASDIGRDSTIVGHLSPTSSLSSHSHDSLHSSSESLPSSSSSVTSSRKRKSSSHHSHRQHRRGQEQQTKHHHHQQHYQPQQHRQSVSSTTVTSASTPTSVGASLSSSKHIRHRSKSRSSSHRLTQLHHHQQQLHRKQVNVSTNHHQRSHLSSNHRNHQQTEQHRHHIGTTQQQQQHHHHRHHHNRNHHQHHHRQTKSTITITNHTYSSLSSSSSSSLKRSHSILLQNLPNRYSDAYLRDSISHECRKFGKVLYVRLLEQQLPDRRAVVRFKKSRDARHALDLNLNKSLFGSKIDVVSVADEFFDDSFVDGVAGGCSGGGSSSSRRGVCSTSGLQDLPLNEFHPKSSRMLTVSNLEKDFSVAELRKRIESLVGDKALLLEIDVRKATTTTIISSIATCEFLDIVSVVKVLRDGFNLLKSLNNSDDLVIRLEFGKSVISSCVWVDFGSASVAAVSSSGTSNAPVNGSNAGGTICDLSKFDEKFLNSVFDKYGSVTHVSVDKSRHRALVFYDMTAAAQACVHEMRGYNLKGQRLQVDFASRLCQDAFYLQMGPRKNGDITDDLLSIRLTNIPKSTGSSSRYSKQKASPSSTTLISTPSSTPPRQSQTNHYHHSHHNHQHGVSSNSSSNNNNQHQNTLSTSSTRASHSSSNTNSKQQQQSGNASNQYKVSTTVTATSTPPITAPIVPQSASSTTIINEVPKSNRDQSTANSPSLLVLSSVLTTSTTTSVPATTASFLKTASSVTNHTCELETLERRGKRSGSDSKTTQSEPQLQHTALLSSSSPPPTTTAAAAPKAALPAPAPLAVPVTSRRQSEQTSQQNKSISSSSKTSSSNVHQGLTIENSLKSSTVVNAVSSAVTITATTASALSAANVIPSSIYATSSLTNSILDSISNSHRNELSNAATPFSDLNSSLSSRPGTPLCDEKPQELNEVTDPRKQACSTSLSAISCSEKRVPLDLPLPLFADQRPSGSDTIRNAAITPAPSSATPTHSTAHFDLFQSTQVTTAISSSTSTTVTTSLNSPVTSPYSQPYITPLTIKTLQTHNALLSKKEAEEAAAAAASTVANGNLLRKSSLTIFGSGGNAIGSSSHHQCFGQTRLLSDINEHYYGNQQSHQQLQTNPKSPKSSSCIALEMAHSPSLSSTSTSSSSSPRHRPNDSSQQNDILDERVRKVSELYAKWDNDGRVASATSGCSGISSFLSVATGASASHVHMATDDARTSATGAAKSSISAKSELFSNYKPLVEFENRKNAEPEQIVEMMLSRPSIFDEDSKRLESAKEKFEIKHLQQLKSTILSSASAVAAVVAAAVSSSVSKLTTAVTAGTASATTAATVHTTSVSTYSLSTLPNGLMKKSLLSETGAAKPISAVKPESKLVPILKKDTNNVAITTFINNSLASETKKTPGIDVTTTTTKAKTMTTTTTTIATTVATAGLVTTVPSSSQLLAATPQKSILKVTSPTQQTTQSMVTMITSTTPPTSTPLLTSPNTRFSDMEGVGVSVGRGGSMTPTRSAQSSVLSKPMVRRPPSPPPYDHQTENAVNDDNKTKDEDKKTRDKLLLQREQREQQQKERDWFQFASKTKPNCDNVVSLSNSLNTTNQSQRVQKVAVAMAVAATAAVAVTTTTVALLTTSTTSSAAKAVSAVTTASFSSTKTSMSDVAKKSLTVPVATQKHQSSKTEKKPSTPPIATVPVPIPSPTLSTSSSSTTSSTKSSNVAKTSASTTSSSTKLSTTSSTKTSQKSKTKHNGDLSSSQHSHSSSNSSHHHHHHHSSSSSSNHHHHGSSGHHSHHDSKSLSKASKKPAAIDGTNKNQSPTSVVASSTSLKLIAAKKKTHSQQENQIKKKKQSQLSSQTKDSANGPGSALAAPPPRPSSTASHDTTSTSSSDDDSDGNRKKSIFEIEQEPSYISMYDKVKARSCKNKQQKQESEKMEIKAKFNQLKQSRAKREEKKRPGSCDEETRFTTSGAGSKTKIGSSSSSSLFGNRQRSSFSGQSDDKKRFMAKNTISIVKNNNDDNDSMDEVEEKESRVMAINDVVNDGRDDADDGDDGDDDDMLKNDNDEDEIIDQNNDDDEIYSFDKLRSLKSCREKRRKMFVKKKKKKTKLIDSSSSENESFPKSFSLLSPNQKKIGSKKKATVSVVVAATDRAVNWNQRYSDDTHSERDENNGAAVKSRKTVTASIVDAVAVEGAVTSALRQDRLNTSIRSPNAATATTNSALNTADECSTDFDIEKKKMKKPMIAATLRKKVPKQHHNNHRNRRHHSNSSTSDVSDADRTSVPDKDDVTSKNKSKVRRVGGHRHQSKTLFSGTASTDDTDNDQIDNEDTSEIDSNRHHYHHHRRRHRHNHYLDDNKKDTENRDHIDDNKKNNFLNEDVCNEDDGENDNETVDRLYLYENKRDNVVSSSNDQSRDRASHQKLELHDVMQSKSVILNIENDENIEERKQKKQHKRKRHEKREKRRKRHREKDEKKPSSKELSAAERAMKKAEEAIFGSISDMNDEDDDEDDEEEDDYEDGVVLSEVCIKSTEERKNKPVDENDSGQNEKIFNLQRASDLIQDNSLPVSPENESKTSKILESANSYSQNVEDKLLRHKRKRKRKHHHSSGLDKETKDSMKEIEGNVSNRDLLFLSDNETNKENQKEMKPQEEDDDEKKDAPTEEQRAIQTRFEATASDNQSKIFIDEVYRIRQCENNRVDCSYVYSTNVEEKVEIDATENKDHIFDELKKEESVNVERIVAIEPMTTLTGDIDLLLPEKQFYDGHSDSQDIQKEIKSSSAMIVEVKTEEERTVEAQLITDVNTVEPVLETVVVPTLEASNRNRISISNEETMNAIAAILSPSFSQDHLQTTYDETKSCSIVTSDAVLVTTSSETNIPSYASSVCENSEAIVHDEGQDQVKESDKKEGRDVIVKSVVPCGNDNNDNEADENVDGDDDNDDDDGESGLVIVEDDTAMEDVNVVPAVSEYTDDDKKELKTSTKEEVKTIALVAERDVSVIVENETVTAYNSMSLSTNEQMLQPELFLQNSESSTISTKMEIETEEKSLVPIRTAEYGEIALQSEFRQETLEKVDDFVVSLERSKITEVENPVLETPIIMPEPIIVEPQLQMQLAPQHESPIQSDQLIEKTVQIERVFELKVPTIERSLPALISLKPEEKYRPLEQDLKTPEDTLATIEEKHEAEAQDQSDLLNHLPESVISLKHPIPSPKSPILPSSPTEMSDYVDAAQKSQSITTRARGRGRGRGGRVGRPAGSGKKRGLITSSNLSNTPLQSICHPTSNQIPKTSSYQQKKNLIASNPISGFNDDVYEFQDETDDNHHLMEYSADVFYEKQSKESVSTNIRSNDVHSKKSQVVASRKSKRIQERNGSGITRDISSVSAVGSFDEVVDEDGHPMKIRRSSRHNAKAAAASASASTFNTSAAAQNKLFGQGSASVITRNKPSLLTSVAQAKTTMTMTSSYDQNNRKEDYDELPRPPSATITTTTLIDPVTGVLTPMRQKDDGKYVPINVQSTSGFVRSVPDEFAPVKKRLSRNSYSIPDINHRSPSIPTTVSASIPSSAAVTQPSVGQSRVITPTVTPPPQSASPSLSANAISQAPQRQSLKKHILERTRQEQQVLMQQRETEMSFMNAFNSTMETTPLSTTSANFSASGMSVGTTLQGLPATLPPTSPPAKASVAIQTPTSVSHLSVQPQLYAAPNYCVPPPHPFVHPRISSNVISSPMSSPSSAMPPPHCPSPKQMISSQSTNFLANEERMASTASLPTISTASVTSKPTSGHDFYQGGFYNRSSTTASIPTNHATHNFAQKQQSLPPSGTHLQNKRQEYLQQHYVNPHSSVGYVGSPRMQVSQFDHSLTPNSNAVYPILSPPVAHQHPISGTSNTTSLTIAEQQHSSHSIYYEKASQQPKLPESAALPQASVVEFNNLSESQLLQQYYERSRAESDTKLPMPTKHGDDSKLQQQQQQQQHQQQHQQQVKQQSVNSVAAAYQKQPSTTTTTNQLQPHLSRTERSPPMLAVVPRYAPSQASQIPPQTDSLFVMLQQQCPIMWQGLLSIKNDRAAVQMYYISGNQEVSRNSLPFLSDSVSAPLRIVQRMRLDQTQVEGVCRKMQTKNDHCILLALPCGKDQLDVVNQSTNLQTGFINYLQQKQAAGIINVSNNNLGSNTATANSSLCPDSVSGASENTSGYIIHIFPKCDFVNEHLSRINPNLLHKVSDLSHLFVIIVTV